MANGRFRLPIPLLGVIGLIFLLLFLFFFFCSYFSSFVPIFLSLLGWGDVWLPDEAGCTSGMPAAAGCQPEL